MKIKLILIISIMIIACLTLSGMAVFAEATEFASEDYQPLNKEVVMRVGSGWSEAADGGVYTSVPSDSSKALVFKFYGIGAAVTFECGSDKGTYDVYVDSVKQEGTFDANGSGTKKFEFKELNSGMHELKVVPTGGSWASVKKFTAYRSNSTQFTKIAASDSANTFDNWATSGDSVWGGVGGGKVMYVPFIGKGIMAVVEYGNDKGAYEFYIDGNKIAGEFSAKEASNKKHALLSYNCDNDGYHILTVKAISGEYATVSHFNVYSDLEDIITLSLPATAAKYTNDWSASIADGYLTLGAPNGESNIVFDFYGIGVAFNAIKNVDKGEVAIFIDDEQVFDPFTGEEFTFYYGGERKELFFKTLGLEKGTHTLEIVPINGQYAQVGSFEVYNELANPEFDITYYNGETELKTEQYVYGTGLEITETAVKTEHSFTGWKDANGNTYESISAAQFGNIILYAQFEANTYNVKYYDGETEIESGSYTYGTGLATLETATKTGYTFTGWKDAQGNAVTSISATATGDVALYAQFTANSYNVKYYDGETEIKSGTYTYGTGLATLETTTKEGYTFTGWKDAQGNAVTSISATATGDVALYAQFTAIQTEKEETGCKSSVMGTTGTTMFFISTFAALFFIKRKRA